MTDQRADDAETRADTAEVRADQAEVRADTAEHRADDAETRQDASDVRQDDRVIDIDARLEALGDRLDEAKAAVDKDREHRVRENVLRDRRIKWSRGATVASLAVGALALVCGGAALWALDQQEEASKDRRVAFCDSLDGIGAIALASGEGAITTFLDDRLRPDAPPIDPEIAELFVALYRENTAAEVAEAVAMVREANGFAPDCTPL